MDVSTDATRFNPVIYICNIARWLTWFCDLTLPFCESPTGVMLFA